MEDRYIQYINLDTEHQFNLLHIRYKLCTSINFLLNIMRDRHGLDHNYDIYVISDGNVISDHSIPISLLKGDLMIQWSRSHLEIKEPE
jgi:hypothetical protein